MLRIELLRDRVSQLYLAKSAHRAQWADWLFENHIFVVSKNAERLAERFGANKELAMAAAMLHDVADSVMARENENHETESIVMARKLLRECDFSVEEIQIVVDDAIVFHGCHGESRPKTMEGKVMATADALAHLQSDFYAYAVEMMKKNGSIERIKQWALPKIDRDFFNKICFKEVRTETATDYGRAKHLIESLRD